MKNTSETSTRRRAATATKIVAVLALALATALAPLASVGLAAGGEQVMSERVMADQATAEQVSVEQSATTSVVAPGETVTLELTVVVPDLNAPGLAVDLPEGWTIRSQSAEGPATYKASTNEWVWLRSGEYAVEYVVAVPDDATAGSYEIRAEASAIEPNSGDRIVAVNRTTLSVEQPDRVTTADDSEPESGNGTDTAPSGQTGTAPGGQVGSSDPAEETVTTDASPTTDVSSTTDASASTDAPLTTDAPATTNVPTTDAPAPTDTARTTNESGTSDERGMIADGETVTSGERQTTDAPGVSGSTPGFGPIGALVALALAVASALASGRIR